MDITYPRCTKGPENRSSDALSDFRAPPSPGAPPWGTDPFVTHITKSTNFKPFSNEF